MSMTHNVHIRNLIFVFDVDGCSLISDLISTRSRYNEFPGEYTGEETPDPLPNSEAKLAQADGSAFA